VAARLAAGDGVPIMVDANCPWTPEQARRMTLELRPYDLCWLEEPIFPPEDFPVLARLREGTGVPTAAGENNCTVIRFRDMFAAGAVDYAQPSVTKVGGVTGFQKVAALRHGADAALALFRSGLPRHAAAHGRTQRAGRPGRALPHGSRGKPFRQSRNAHAGKLRAADRTGPERGWDAIPTPT